MNQAGSYACGETWVDFENLQMGKPTGFPDRLDVDVRERGVKNVSVDFGLNNWKNVAAIYRNAEDSGQSMTGEENQEFSLKRVKFKMPIRRVSGDNELEIE